MTLEDVDDEEESLEIRIRRILEDLDDVDDEEEYWEIREVRLRVILASDGE